jgi:hypothetical protein
VLFSTKQISSDAERLPMSDAGIGCAVATTTLSLPKPRRAAGPGRQTPVALLFAEYRRAMSASRRYQELRGRPAGGGTAAPRLVFEEFYSAGASL